MENTLLVGRELSDHGTPVDPATVFRPYSIIWEKDFSAFAGALSELKLAASRICIVADSNVAPLYAQALKEALPASYRTDLYVFPAGEAHKNLDTVKGLYSFLIENKYSRKDILIALGGGVTGDLTGFTAATYLRGIDFIQVPTTLLAQVDSSVGGKTGVDFDQYKNMVGAFHQPRLVYMNMQTLTTLDELQFACGMGEVLKTGLIRNKALYQWIGEHRHEIQERNPEMLSYMIRECCKVKAQVVSEDPTEKGVRAILNLGHTIGHAVEKLEDFRLLHGQCVAVGTTAAAYLSLQKGLLKRGDLQIIRELNTYFRLPNAVSGLKAEDILAATKNDKKASAGKIRFILLAKVGEALVDDTVTDADLLDAINYILK